MEKLTTFTIALSSDNPVYVAGSNVEGKVILELNEPERTQGIRITLSGIAYVKWRETELNRRRSDRELEIINYFDSQAIFKDITLQLWGNGDTEEISAGKYEFPFKFQLPDDLPTSFESGSIKELIRYRNVDTQGLCGYIRYFLKASVLRSSKFDHVVKKAITVLEILDINQPHMKQPLSSSKEKTLGCLCCASGPISLSVMTDRVAYCPGESIAISTEIENHSSRIMTTAV